MDRLQELEGEFRDALERRLQLGDIDAMRLFRDIAGPEHLTVEQVARRFQVTPQTVYKWCREGYIPHLTLGGVIRFDAADLAEWEHTRKRGGADA